MFPGSNNRARRNILLLLLSDFGIKLILLNHSVNNHCNASFQFPPAMAPAAATETAAAVERERLHLQVGEFILKSLLMEITRGFRKLVIKSVLGMVNWRFQRRALPSPDLGSPPTAFQPLSKLTNCFHVRLGFRFFFF